MKDDLTKNDKTVNHSNGSNSNNEHRLSLFQFLLNGMQYHSYCFMDLSRSVYNAAISVAKQNKFTKTLNMSNTNNNEVIYRRAIDVKCEDKSKYDNLTFIKSKFLNKAIEPITKLQPINHFNQNSSHISINEIQSLIAYVIKDQINLDSNNRCALFGYGCNIPPDYDILCNCYAMNFDIMNPYVDSHNDIIDLYLQVMNSFYLSGTPILSEVLTHFYKYVEAQPFTPYMKHYHVGVFVLSNMFHDKDDFIKIVSRNTHLPCTLILISIGDECKSLSALSESLTAEIQSSSRRVNFIYINYHLIYMTHGATTNEDEDALHSTLLTTCKDIYNKINEQFIEYVKHINTTEVNNNNNNNDDVDGRNNNYYTNQNNPDYIEFRQNKMNMTVNSLQFLEDEKEALIENIRQLKYDVSDLNDTFKGKVPTFDRHYILNSLNKNKSKKLQQRNTNVSGHFHKQRNKQYIMYNNQIIINDRKMFREPASEQSDVVMKDDKDNIVVTSQTKGSKDAVYDNVICNICKVNKINIVFQYCKHRYCCIYCIPKVKDETCPICTRKVELFVQVFSTK